jgi:hypothetical protein
MSDPAYTREAFQIALRQAILELKEELAEAREVGNEMREISNNLRNWLDSHPPSFTAVTEDERKRASFERTLPVPSIFSQ